MHDGLLPSVRHPFGTTALGVECDDAPVADESDDGAPEREVLTNLPRTRPARRSARRASTPQEPEAAPEPTPEPPTVKRRSPAKPAAAGRPAPKPAEPETVVPPTRAAPPMPTREPHRSPVADIAVTSIELTGEVFRLGIDLTRAIVRATLGRMPRP